MFGLTLRTAILPGLPSANCRQIVGYGQNWRIQKLATDVDKLMTNLQIEYTSTNRPCVDSRKRARGNRQIDDKLSAIVTTPNQSNIVSQVAGNMRIQRKS